MNEVSGKANQLILEACARCGIAAEQLVEGLPIDVESLRDVRRRMDWDLHVELIERLQQLCGGPEALEAAGAAVHNADALRRTRSLGALFLDARRMFWIGSRWIGPSLFTHAVYRYEELAGGRVRMTVEVPDDYRASEAFFRIMLGALRSTPLAAGYSKPAVVSLDTDGRRAEFLIDPPPRPSLWSFLRRLVRLPFVASHAIEELSEQQEALNRSVRELAAAQQQIGQRELQLETLDALGRQLVHEVETERVGDGLLESLRARFGWNGAALWIERRGASNELELLCHSGGDAGPARAHLLRAGGRVVGRLDVWGGDAGDDPVRGEVFERVLPWIAMAVSSAHARDRNGGRPSEFRWTGESGKDLFLIVDADGGIRYASPTIEALLGISQEDAAGLAITGLVHPEDWPGLEHTFATSLIGPGSAAFSQARVRHGDGSWRVLEGVGIKVLDEHRRDVYLLACSDVTERQRAH
jgi:PAS domain S-box-containing protein